MKALSTLEQFALAKYPNGLIDGITYEDGFGEIVWISLPNKSTMCVSTKQMLLEIEGARFSSSMADIRKQIEKAIGVLQ